MKSSLFRKLTFCHPLDTFQEFPLWAIIRQTSWALLMKCLSALYFIVQYSSWTWILQLVQNCTSSGKPRKHRGRIWKLLRSRGIDFKESIRQTYVTLAGRYDNPICRTGPPGYIRWRNRFTVVDSWAPETFTNSALIFGDSYMNLFWRYVLA